VTTIWQCVHVHVYTHKRVRVHDFCTNSVFNVNDIIVLLKHQNDRNTLSVKFSLRKPCSKKTRVQFGTLSHVTFSSWQTALKFDFCYFSVKIPSLDSCLFVLSCKIRSGVGNESSQNWLLLTYETSTSCKLLFTSNKEGGKCLCPHLFICLSVCEQDYSKTRAWIWMKCCVSTDVGTWTN